MIKKVLMRDLFIQITLPIKCKWQYKVVQKYFYKNQEKIIYRIGKINKIVKDEYK